MFVRMTAGLWILGLGLEAFAAATVTEGTMTLPTYPFSDPDPVPCTERKIYPYERFDGSSWTAEPRTWKTVTLENDRIRVVVTPEIGGKVWGATDKKTGVDFIYFNHVAKFRDIAQRGPWTSGGIEFNFGIVGHSPTCSTPVDWCVKKNSDGSVSCFVGATEWICRTTWQVEIRLGADDDFFETRTIWTNGSNFPAPYYQWMNAAFHLERDAKFDFPGRYQLFHDGKGGTWPVDAGRNDLSVYANNAFGGEKSYHVVNGDNGYYGVWWPSHGVGAYHRNAVNEKYGRKIWLWALSRAGGIWEDLLTDTDGQYTELQSGRVFVQPGANIHETPFKHPTFAAGITDCFTERWGVMREEPKPRTDGFAEERPLEMPKDFDWDTAYGRYVRGIQLVRDANYTNGVALLKSCLEKEPGFAPALDELALQAARCGHYAEARDFARRALAIDTYDAAANYADGVAAFAAGDFTTAKERLGLAAYSPLYRVPALTRSAKCEMRIGDWEAARVLAQKALDANAHSPDAALACMVSYRKLGAKGSAEALGQLFEIEQPLCAGVRYERGKLKTDDAQTLLELGSWYEEAGLLKEAADVFARAKGSIVAEIRRAYVTQGSLDAAKKMPIAGAAPFRRESRPALEWAVRTDGDWRFKYLLAVLEAATCGAEKAKDLLAACGDEPDDAVFYLYRAKFSSGAARLKDLERAAKLGDSWRVGLALCEHQAAEGRHDLALATAKDYLARFPGNNALELAEARAMEKLGRYAACVAFLKTVKLLPSEHGGNASGIWIACHRALAEKALAAGDREAAAKFVNDGLSYPENLGRGKPFSTDDAVKDWPEELKALRREKTPYEFEWAGRWKDEFPPLQRFEGTEGWTLEATDAEATIADCDERALFGTGVVRLRHRATGKSPVMRLRPPEPIACPDGFDTVTLWIYGNNIGGAAGFGAVTEKNPAVPSVAFNAEFEDAAGRPFTVSLGIVRHKEWFEQIGILAAKDRGRSAKGARLVGLTVTNGIDRAWRQIDFTSLCVFRDPQRPLGLKPRAKRGVQVFPECPQGLNTGTGTLPFPNRADTVIPPSAELPEKLEFRLPKDPTDWGDLAFRYGGGEWIPLAVGGGVFPRDAAAKAKVVFRQQGNSLVAEVSAPEPGVESVRFGSARFPGGAELVDWPYYTYGFVPTTDDPNASVAFGPKTAVARLGGRTLFVSAVFDWTQSNASTPCGPARADEGLSPINGGTLYRPKTDGRRNGAFERFVWTFSERVEDTLPVIPNPESPWKKVTGTHLWTSHAASPDRAKDVAYWRAVKAAGMTKVIVTDHEVGWRDGNESFTFRTRPAPKKGGDRGQYDYARTMIDEFGFYYGPYNNFTDFAPVNGFWSIDRVGRESDGTPTPAWNRCYSPKPSWSVGMCERLAPEIQRKFSFNTAYCDVHTCVSPWSRCDYDARVPGAGTFAGTFYAYGEIMLLQRAAWRGPVYSEGTYQYLYAGLTDGNYAQDSVRELCGNPWLVDFDLRRIHRLCCNFGMGSPAMFCWWHKGEKGDMYYDRFLAATLAFGHPGFFPHGRDPNDLKLQKRFYFLLQAIAARYTQVEATAIEYGDEDGRLHPTSAALANGCYRRSQVRVTYADGTVVAANGSEKADFTVEVNGKTWTLPPNGWRAETSDGSVISFCGMENGRRVRYAKCPDYEYRE